MPRKHLQQFRNIDWLALGALTAAVTVGVPLQQAFADAQIVKVTNKNIAVGVDNGWVAFEDPNEVQDSTTLPEVTHYVVDSSGDFGAAKAIKLKTPSGYGLSSGGPDAVLGGVVFAPSGVGKSLPSGSASTDGFGILFGEAIAQGGGQGSSNGGWVTDDNVEEHLTNTNLNPGSISAVAVGSSGSYAVGWDLASTNFVQGVILTLNATKGTYAPTSETYLGTLGGDTSQALGISAGGTYVVGTADDASGTQHAVYATPGATAWTNITSGFPANVVKSQALIATDTGLIAGTATVKESVAGRSNVPVDQGFLYNISSQTVTFFPVSGANVQPMAILANGDVVGQLALVVPQGAAAGTLPSYHPFLFDGTTVTDFGTMTVGSSASYGCRVNGADLAGELVGSCIATSAGPYGESGTAFYINASSASAAFVNLNAVLQSSTTAATKKAVKGYNIGSATDIDAEEEVSLFAVQTKTGDKASFLISKNAYLP